MSKKTTALIFAAGAVAGWKLAQRAAGEQEPSYSYGAPAAIEPSVTSSDPFREAFQQAEDVSLHHQAPKASWEAA